MSPETITAPPPGRPAARSRLPEVMALVVVLVAVLGGTARAQDDVKASAQKKMAQGAQLLEQGQPAEALRLFREAYAQAPNPRYQYNIGVACQATGRDAEALEAFEAFLANAQGVHPEYTADAQKQAALLRARVATVTVTSKESGAGVLVDGRDVGQTPLPNAVILDPGEHRFLVRKPSFEPFERVLALKPGDSVTVAAELRALPAPVAPPIATIVAPPPPVVVAAPEESPVYKRWWFWTAVGAVVLTGVVVAVAASSGSGSSGPTCPGGEFICVK
jgi:hypothetical protein